MNIIRRKISCISERAQLLSEVNLLGRDYINPKNLTSPEIKSILWTALDIEHLAKRRQIKLKQLEPAKVTLILDKPCMKTSFAISNAAKLLNVHLNSTVDYDCYDNEDFQDYGRTAAIYSDIIFCKLNDQDKIDAIANGANCPVIAINSNTYNLVKNLADLLSVYQHFNRLKGLTVSYVGTPSTTLNTFLCTLPLLKMNFKYFLFDDTPEQNTPQYVEIGRKLSQIHNCELHESKTIEEVIYRTNVIKTIPHACAKHQITMKNVNEAAIKWALLHDLPRGSCELEKLVFSHENSLVWKSMKNMEIIYAALIVRFLICYCHVLKEPNFDEDSTE